MQTVQLAIELIEKDSQDFIDIQITKKENNSIYNTEDTKAQIGATDIT